jgi:hypothetical protein
VTGRDAVLAVLDRRDSATVTVLYDLTDLRWDALRLCVGEMVADGALTVGTERVRGRDRRVYRRTR